MQPVFAGDVAKAVAASAGDRSTFGNTYELAGPQVYTLADLVRFTAATLGIKRWVFVLPGFLSRIQGMFLGLVPGKPFSLDNYHSLQVDNIAKRNGLRYFGIVPAALEAIVPSYLGESLRQRRLGSFRSRARR